MINCITKHGQWKQGVVPFGTIMHITAYINPKLCYCVIFEERGRYFVSPVFSIKFYDTNGKYTGFRLKSLK